MHLKNWILCTYSVLEQYNNNYNNYESNDKLNTNNKFVLSNDFQLFKLEDNECEKSKYKPFLEKSN